MALFGTAVSLGIVAGPVLGIVLNGASISLGDVRLDGYSMPFVAAGSIALVAAILLRWGLVESRMSDAEDPPAFDELTVRLLDQAEEAELFRVAHVADPTRTAGPGPSRR